MKMKKFFAVLLAMVMVVAMATGCSKKGASKTNTDASGNSVTSTVSLKYEGEEGKADLTLVSKAAGKNASISVSGSVDIEGTTVNAKADDLFVVANDKFYVNVKAALDAIANVEDAAESVNAIKELITEDYIYMDMSGISEAIQEADVKTSTEMIDALMAAYKDVSTGTDDKVVIKVTNAEEAKAFTDATAKFLKDNADKIADYFVASYNKVDIEKLMNSVVDAVVDSMMAAYKEMGMEVTDEQKQQAKDMILSQIDMSELEVSKEDIVKAVKEMADSMEVDEDADFDGTELNVTIEKTANGYKVSVKANDADNSLEIAAEMDTASSVSISAPSKAQNVNDIISGLMAAFGALE